MPELPEVETIVRSLRPRLEGARIADLWTSGLPLRLARAVDSERLRQICRGVSIGSVERRGKYIVITMHAVPPVDAPVERFAGPTGGAVSSGGVLVHLGMSGRLRLQAGGESRDKHTHVVWSLAGGDELRFVDPRRFGLVRAWSDGERLVELAKLGPDPLAALDGPTLARALASSRAPIKAFLLDQSRVAGLGNIYVCEALHRAGVHPGTPAHRAQRRAEALVAAIRAALELGIANRGTTLRDYVDADGGAGENQGALLVYGREGEACRRCGARVRRRVDAQRSTFFCSSCQRR